MGNKTLLYFLLISCFVFHYRKADAQVPTFNSVTSNSTTIEKFEKFELTIFITAAYSNPYDYDDILLQGIFTAPSGKKDTIEGFYMQDYSLNASTGNLTSTGNNNFKIRYAPSETGTYSYIITCKNTIATTSTTAASFSSVVSDKKGFIKKNTTNYLNFDNGQQYIPVGQNMGWQNNNKYLDFKNWTDKMAANNANFIRLWQCAWGLGIEWKGSPYEGLKKYRQDNAYYTDLLLDECKAKDIYMMLCINHHGMVSSNVNPNWPDNPYNAVNGGPCVNTWDYFINSTAKSLHKNRLRYIIARWGFSRNIMSWELFNEVEWTDNFSTYKTQIKDWHQEMAAFLKSKDTFHHLVTTSFANDFNDAATWNLSEIDFTQTHFYNGSPNVEAVLVGGVQNYLSQFNKPTFTGEFGIDAGNISLSTIDPNGIYFHNSLWATMFGGGLGAGASWWWDNYIEPQNLYRHYKPLSAFNNTISFYADHFKTVNVSTTGGGTSDLVLSPGIGFALATASAFTIDAAGNISPSASQLSGYLFGSTWNTQYRNPPTFTVTYSVAGQFKVTTGSGTGTAPKINIYLDGNSVLAQDANSNTTYTINVSAGVHTIKVDNLGTDWINISNYTFTNIGSALNTYVLKSENSEKAVGWIHNKKYNWQFVKDNGLPAAVTGSTLNIPGMKNGTYTVQFTDCTTGLVNGTITATASGNNLVITLPSIAWDVAITAVYSNTTPVFDLPVANQIQIYPNPVTHNKLLVKYDLLSFSKVYIDLIDISGNKAAILFDGKQIAGSHLIEWNTMNHKLAEGVYFIRLFLGNEAITKKIIFIAE